MLGGGAGAEPPRAERPGNLRRQGAACPTRGGNAERADERRARATGRRSGRRIQEAARRERVGASGGPTTRGLPQSRDDRGRNLGGERSGPRCAEAERSAAATRAPYWAGLRGCAVMLHRRKRGTAKGRRAA